MWTKTINTKYKKLNVQVQIWLDGDDGDNVVVKVQSIVNEYFLIQEIRFENRDSAYDFIKDFPVSMANSFIIREGFSTGAIA